MAPFERKKFINLVSIIAFLLITAIIPYLVFEYIAENIRRDVLNAMQTVNETTAQTVDLWVEEEKTIVKSWGEQGNTTLTTHVERLLKVKPIKSELEKSETSKQLREHLKPLVKNKSYEDFFIISPDFINIASMWSEHLGQTNFLSEKTDVLQRAFQGESILTSPQTLDIPLRHEDGSMQLDVPAMFAISPIRSQKDDIIALLMFRINPSERFTHLLQLGRIGKTGETYAIDNSATLISNSRYEDELREHGIIAANKPSILNIAMRDPGYNLLDKKQAEKAHTSNSEAPLTVMAKSLISGSDGHNLDGYRDYRGVPVIGVWRKSPQLDIGIATEINVDDAFSTLHTIWLAIMLSAAINILLIFALMMKFIQHNIAVRLQSLQDGLTGLSNRRMLDIKLDMEFTSSVRNRQPLSICMIDIDYFKLFNDKLGHLAGDNALKTVAEALQTTIKRKSDLVARFGGEEFCVVLPNTSLEEALVVAERIRETVIDLKVPHHKSHSHPYLTISIGVTSLLKGVDTGPEDVICRADRGLYMAKQAGRNCVKVCKE